MLKRWHISLFLVAFILGILMAIQFQAQQQIDNNKLTTAERNVALLEVLKKAETGRTAYENEIETLRKQIGIYEKVAADQQVITPGISAELDTLRLLTGSTPVIGPGIIVTLNDSVSFDKIASSDLQDLVNILRYAGAEALSINGQRIIASSAIHEAGNNMLINKTPINRTEGAPYEIKAIGEPATLNQLLRISNGMVSSLTDLKGVKVDIIEAKTLDIPALSGGVVYTLAKPVNQ